MIALALSLSIATVQTPHSSPDWVGLGLGFAGAGAAVGLSWKYIMEDKPNQPPRLAIVPPPESPPAEQDFVQNPESPAESEIEFPFHIFDENAPSPPVPPAPALAPVPMLFSGVNLPEKLEPGEVDFALIRQLPWEERKEWLFGYLAEHKCEYLFRLLEATPIIIYGMERCGKSTLAYTIAALRRIYFPQPFVGCIPNRNPDNPPPPFVQWVGFHPESGSDHRAIANVVRSLYELVSKGDVAPVTYIWDELSKYEFNFDPADRSLLDAFTLFCMSETEKHCKYQILIASGMTNDCLPGSEGTAKYRGSGTIGISRFAQLLSYGKKQPSELIEIEGMFNSPGDTGKKTFTFPKWLNAGWILSAFPEACELLPPLLPPPEVAVVTSTSPVVTSETTTAPLEVGKLPLGERSNILAFPTTAPTTTTTTTTTTERKLLFLSVQPYLNEGKSPSWVVENIWGIKGRSFTKGKQFLDQLIQEFKGDNAS